MDLLVGAHRFDSAVPGTHHPTQGFDNVCRYGRGIQINLLAQEGRWLARAACVKDPHGTLLIYFDRLCSYLYCRRYDQPCA